MDSVSDRLKHYFDYRDQCWKQHKEYKEIKDKILFFIGTLFVTALIGTSFIIYAPNIVINPFIYLVQYILVQICFLLLFLYYQYNRLVSEVYLQEAVQCDRFLKKNIPLISITEVKNTFIYTENWYLQGKKFKYLANWLLGIAYAIFSFSPLIFKFGVIKLAAAGFALEWSFVIPLALFIIALIALDRMYRMNEKKITQLIEEKWKKDN